MRASASTALSMETPARTPNKRDRLVRACTGGVGATRQQSPPGCSSDARVDAFGQTPRAGAASTLLDGEDPFIGKGGAQALRPWHATPSDWKRRRLQHR